MGFCLMMNGQLYGAAVGPKGMICPDKLDRKPSQPGLCSSWSLCSLISSRFGVGQIWNEGREQPLLGFTACIRGERFWILRPNLARRSFGDEVFAPVVFQSLLFQSSQ